MPLTEGPVSLLIRCRDQAMRQCRWDLVSTTHASPYCWPTSPPVPRATPIKSPPYSQEPSCPLAKRAGSILAGPHPLLDACPWLLVEGPREPRGPEATGHVVPGMPVLSRSPERTQLHPHLLPGRGVLRLDCTEGARDHARVKEQGEG